MFERIYQATTRGGLTILLIVNKLFLWAYEENACNSTIYTWTGGDKVRLKIIDGDGIICLDTSCELKLLHLPLFTH